MEDEPSDPAIDTATGLRYAGGRPALYQRLLGRFEVTQQDVVTRIDAAVGRGDMVEAYRLAHTLKSAAATVGAMPLSDAARALEAAYAAGRTAVAEAALTELRERFDEAMRVIRARLGTDPAPPG
ncbi:Hpt domain-containing protein [Nitrogeniibacter mangrovi]|uniref:Hpt domain-containing protein n=1 Tax=Nitrogeniibacter mangrovi TaxID=2016596 RepID=A0A6C1B1Y8_9RHOO|nr:Hpt domain-containing protein [Nitrogeniibacter mangrovi]QID16915.1 Hpt domain-containing protein [Nitrogeniibacter mangrovi]